MPANVVQEHIDSREYTYSSGKASASRTFKVYSSLGGITTPAAIKSLFGTGTAPDPLPNIGDLFPSETVIRAKSYTIKKDEGSNVWTVVFQYTTGDITSTDFQPQEPGYVEWTLDVAASFADTFVIGATYPKSGTTDGVEEKNRIATGQQVDIEGVPVSALRMTTDINISEVVESYGGPPTVYTASRAARGRRNSASWYGIEKGKALYLGMTCKRIGVNLYSCSHKIQEATDFHLVQYAARDSVGRIPTATKTGKQRAEAVYWKQPFKDFFDFSSISSNW